MGIATVFVFAGMMANEFWLTMTLWAFAGIALVEEDRWLKGGGFLDKRVDPKIIERYRKGS